MCLLIDVSFNDAADKSEYETGVYRFLLGKPEGRRPLGRPRRRWVDNRMDLQEVGCGYMDWIGLAQDRDCLSSPLSTCARDGYLYV